MLPTLTGPLDLEGVDFARDDLPDLHAVLRALRSRKPAAVVLFFGQPALMFLSYELVAAAFKDEEAFPAAASYRLNTEPVLGRTLQCMEREDHRINRALVSPAFRPRVISEKVKPLLQSVAQELVDRFARRGTADLVAEFTKEYPFLVITRLLGLPPANDGDFQRWAYDLFNYPIDPEGAKRSSAEFTRFLAPLVARRRNEPGDDLLSTLATAEVEGRRLSDEEIFSFVRLLFPAGADTTYLGLGSTLYALLTHPAEYERVLADRSERRWAAEEGLRWEPPVGLLPRRAPRAVRWHDTEIPADTTLIYAITAANRDPQVFHEPDRFDVGRHAEATIAFGQGPHYCLGAHLALSEMEIALDVILERLRGLRLVEDPEVRIRGMLGTALRGPTKLPVRFEPH